MTLAYFFAVLSVCCLVLAVAGVAGDWLERRERREWRSDAAWDDKWAERWLSGEDQGGSGTDTPASGGTPPGSTPGGRWASGDSATAQGERMAEHVITLAEAVRRRSREMTLEALYDLVEVRSKGSDLYGLALAAIPTRSEIEALLTLAVDELVAALAVAAERLDVPEDRLIARMREAVSQ